MRRAVPPATLHHHHGVGPTAGGLSLCAVRQIRSSPCAIDTLSRRGARPPLEHGDALSLPGSTVLLRIIRETPQRNSKVEEPLSRHVTRAADHQCGNHRLTRGHILAHSLLERGHNAPDHTWRLQPQIARERLVVTNGSFASRLSRISRIRPARSVSFICQSPACRRHPRNPDQPRRSARTGAAPARSGPCHDKAPHGHSGSGATALRGDPCADDWPA